MIKKRFLINLNGKGSNLRVMKCRICKKYNKDLDECLCCEFEFDEDTPLYDDWDILELDDDYEWSHIQIMDRLKSEGIDCLFADIWTDDNMAFIVGCNERTHKIAGVLNIHEEVIYNDSEHSFIMLNLFQEKYIRGLLKD